MSHEKTENIVSKQTISSQDWNIDLNIFIVNWVYAPWYLLRFYLFYYIFIKFKSFSNDLLNFNPYFLQLYVTFLAWRHKHTHTHIPIHNTVNPNALQEIDIEVNRDLYSFILIFNISFRKAFYFGRGVLTTLFLDATPYLEKYT